MKSKKKYAVEMIGISKYFGDIKANENINLSVEEGSIHALIGENGAGKSTLMSMLFGLYEPTKGKIKIRGKEWFIKDPNVANDLKIGMVHQHFKLVDIYSAIQNITLGAEKTIAKQLLNPKIARKKIKYLQQEYKMDFNLKTPVSKLSVGVQQKIEIMKMLYRDAEILVFDEPTAVLTPSEIDGLLESMKHFKKLGKTIIFITHKLHEVMNVADRATVIRKGTDIGTIEIKDASISQLSEMMVGAKVVKSKNTSTMTSTEVLFEMKNVFTKKKTGTKQLKNISFDVKVGEIVAIAGVEGNGQTELAEVISGLSKIHEGEILLHGHDISKLPPKKRYNASFIRKDKSLSKENKQGKYGLSHVPEDRHKYAGALNFSVSDNMVIQIIDEKPFSKLGLINKRAVSEYSNQIIDRFDVRGAREGKSIFRSLSGGNQQKAVVGREIFHNHSLIMTAQPTRGLDIGAINNIHSVLIKEKEYGKGVILISFELDEVLALADKIVVMAEGQVTGIRDAKKVTKTELGLLMAGSTKDNKEVVND